MKSECLSEFLNQFLQLSDFTWRWRLNGRFRGRWLLRAKTNEAQHALQMNLDSFGGGKYMEMLTFWAILILRSSSSSSLKTSSAHFEPHVGWVVDWWCWHSRDSVTACRKNIHPASSYWTLKCAHALALKMGQPQIQQAESCWIIT